MINPNYFAVLQNTPLPYQRLQFCECVNAFDTDLYLFLIGQYNGNNNLARTTFYFFMAIFNPIDKILYIIATKFYHIGAR